MTIHPQPLDPGPLDATGRQDTPVNPHQRTDELAARMLRIAERFTPPLCITEELAELALRDARRHMLDLQRWLDAAHTAELHHACECTRLAGELARATEAET